MARPSLGSIKSCTLTASGAALGCHSRPLCFEIAYQFFLLGIDGNDWFIRRQKRFGLIIDVVKLGIPIHMAAAFPGFTVGLQTVSQFTQAVSNHMRANRMPLTVQRLETSGADFWMSSAAPASGRHGLPVPRGVPDQAIGWNPPRRSPGLPATQMDARVLRVGIGRDRRPSGLAARRPRAGGLAGRG